LLNILGLKIGVTGKDLFNRRAMSDLTDDHGDRDSQPRVGEGAKGRGEAGESGEWVRG